MPNKGESEVFNTQMAKTCNYYVNRLLLKSEDTEMTHITTKAKQIVMIKNHKLDDRNCKVLGDNMVC